MTPEQYAQQMYALRLFAGALQNCTLDLASLHDVATGGGEHVGENDLALVELAASFATHGEQSDP